MEDTAPPPVPPCDLSTPRTLLATEQPSWAVGDQTYQFLGVVERYDPTEDALDLWISQRWRHPGSTFSTTVYGRARVPRGSSLTGADLASFTEWTSNPPEWRAAIPVYGRFDLDGDGWLDLPITYGQDAALPSDHHELRFQSGTLQGFQELDAWTWRFVLPTSAHIGSFTAGDFNGDGHDDVAVFVMVDDEPELPFRARVFHGPFDVGTTTWAPPDVEIAIATQPANLGGPLPSFDVDGDGIDDLLVPWAIDDWVHLDLYRGPLDGKTGRTDRDASLTLADHHTVWSAGLGYLLPMDVGDFDGDGVSDLLVTAPEIDEGGGMTAVFRGPLTGDLTTNDAWLAILGVPGRADVVGERAAFIELDQPPLELVSFDASEYRHTPDDRLRWGALRVYDHTQSGRLSPDDARVTLVNDGVGVTINRFDPIRADVDGDRREDVLFWTPRDARVPNFCP